MRVGENHKDNHKKRVEKTELRAPWLGRKALFAFLKPSLFISLLMSAHLSAQEAPPSKLPPTGSSRAFALLIQGALDPKQVGELDEDEIKNAYDNTTNFTRESLIRLGIPRDQILVHRSSESYEALLQKLQLLKKLKGSGGQVVFHMIGRAEPFLPSTPSAAQIFEKGASPSDFYQSSQAPREDVVLYFERNSRKKIKGSEFSRLLQSTTGTDTETLVIADFCSAKTFAQGCLAPNRVVIASEAKMGRTVSPVENDIPLIHYEFGGDTEKVPMAPFTQRLFRALTLDPEFLDQPIIREYLMNQGVKSNQLSRAFELAQVAQAPMHGGATPMISCPTKMEFIFCEPTYPGCIVQQFEEIASRNHELSGEIILGDVNGDGKVNIEDTFMAADFHNMLKSVDERALFAMDLDQDGDVDVLDYTELIRRTGEDYYVDQNGDRKVTMVDINAMLIQGKRILLDDVNLDGKMDSEDFKNVIHNVGAKIEKKIIKPNEPFPKIKRTVLAELTPEQYILLLEERLRDMYEQRIKVYPKESFIGEIRAELDPESQERESMLFIYQLQLKNIRTVVKNAAESQLIPEWYFEAYSKHLDSFVNESGIEALKKNDPLRLREIQSEY